MARKIKLSMVDKGELGHIHPQTVIYNVGNKIFLLAEDESGNYLIKPVYKNGTLGETILSKNFGRYYDIVQAAYDDVTATTYICMVDLAGKNMEVYSTTTLDWSVHLNLNMLSMIVKTLTSSLSKDACIITMVVKTQMVNIP